MLHILLTFDYELFFNDSYATEKEVLIDSAEIIKEGLDKAGVKGTFFVDSPCLYKYSSIGLQEFPIMVNNQLNEFLDDGHDVQLHIHPSWFSSEYDGKNWKFDQSKYSLEDYENPQELIRISKNALDSVVGNNSNYSCLAFRAGGFCLKPEKKVLQTLYQLGIRYDSSVCPGTKMEAIGQSYNWEDITMRKQWNFDPVAGVRVFSKSANFMTEIPIGTFAGVPEKWVLTHGQPRLNYPPFKGKPSPVIPINNGNGVKRILNRIYASFTTPILFSLDSLHYNALTKITEEFYKYSKKNNEETYVCAIGHPKFSSKQSVHNMVTFIQYIEETYAGEIDFVTFKDIERLSNT